MGIPFRVEKVELDDDAVGETVGLFRRIQISNDVTRRQSWNVLLHEWAHAVMYVNGAASVIPDGVEEMMAQSLEHALEELLMQIGPQLLAALHEEDE